MRVHHRKPEMGSLGVGVTLFSVLLLFEPPKSFVDWVVVSGIGGMAAWLIAGGLFHRVPVAVVEEPWDERFDELRDQTHAFVRHLDNEYTAFRARLPGSRKSWRDYTTVVPIPRPDRRPLHEWESRFEQHKSSEVRELFEFAREATRGEESNDYRRFAVRTYDRFGKLLAAKAPGFREWMEEEDVEAGAEPIIVMLAYMEVARACTTRLGKPGSRRTGFWFLAESWHPHVMALARRGQSD
jgi:hypothetical protein